MSRLRITLESFEKVLAWIQERFTCHMPDKESDLDLHRLVLDTKINA